MLANIEQNNIEVKLIAKQMTRGVGGLA